MIELDLARALEELHERLEEAGGMTAAQVSILPITLCRLCSKKLIVFSNSHKCCY